MKFRPSGICDREPAEKQASNQKRNYTEPRSTILSSPPPIHLSSSCPPQPPQAHNRQSSQPSRSPPKSHQDKRKPMDIGTHIDNAALWGEDIAEHTKVVVSHMTRDSAEYIIESNNSLVYIHCPENCTVLFSQPVPHGVKRGQKSIRHNTTHRVWIKNADLERFFKSSKQFKINPSENTRPVSHLEQLDRWTIYIFPGNQWLALKKSPMQKHADWIAEFEAAKKHLTQDPVSFRHRRAWQTGTRFNYATSRVESIPSRTPEALARLSIRNISQALPFHFTLRQSIYNEYF